MDYDNQTNTPPGHISKAANSEDIWKKKQCDLKVDQNNNNKKLISF